MRRAFLLAAVLVAGCGSAQAPRATHAPHERRASIGFAGRGAGIILGPNNYAAPTIAGTLEVGQTLTGTAGSWTESPSFTYQWEECSTLPFVCKAIGGATATTYKLAGAQAAQRMKFAVTATVGARQAVAKSAETEAVKEEAEEAERTKECFNHEEACGYPGPENTGVEKGVELTASGGITAKTEGQVIKNLRITGGGIQVLAKNVHIENVEIEVANLRKPVCEEHKITSSTGIIRIGNNVGSYTGTVINHVTVHGPSPECPELGGNTVENSTALTSPSQLLVEHSKFYNTPLCFKGMMQIEGNFCEINGVSEGAHYDGLYLGAGSAIVLKNTFRMPHNQTSNIACFTDAGNIETFTVEKNFIAGGGFVAYLCDKFPGTPGKEVLGPVRFVNNRIARCLTEPFEAEGAGGKICHGFPENPAWGGYGNSTPDAHGYWPKGGFFGELAVEKVSVTTVSGNVWDEKVFGTWP